jgi:hypothetical protein
MEGHTVLQLCRGRSETLRVLIQAYSNIVYIALKHTAGINVQDSTIQNVATLEHLQIHFDVILGSKT